MSELTARYRSDVRRVFAGHSAEPMFNGSVQHAAVVLAEAFRSSRNYVRILAHKLDEASYGTSDVLDGAIQFLELDDVNLDILVENTGPTGCARDNPFLQTVLAVGGSKARVRQVPPALLERYDYNFLIVDEMGYRFENDRRQHIAVVAGGVTERNNVELLRDLFDDLWNISEAWEVPILPARSHGIAETPAFCG